MRQFGFSGFREGQQEAVMRVLCGQCLVQAELACFHTSHHVTRAVNSGCYLGTCLGSLANGHPAP